MRTDFRLLIILPLLLPAAAGCGKKESGAKTITLTEVSSGKMAYKIKIPKGSKTLQKSTFGHTYSLVLEGGTHELNTNLSPMGFKSLAALVRTAKMMGGKAIEQQKETAGGFLVVKKPRGSIVQVFFSKKGKTKSVTAKCTGPTSHKDKLIEICTSLQVTK